VAWHAQLSESQQRMIELRKEDELQRERERMEAIAAGVIQINSRSEFEQQCVKDATASSLSTQHPALGLASTLDYKEMLADVARLSERCIYICSFSLPHDVCLRGVYIFALSLSPTVGLQVAECSEHDHVRDEHETTATHACARCVQRRDICAQGEGSDPRARQRRCSPN
jgi:hypothetical protein